MARTLTNARSPAPNISPFQAADGESRSPAHPDRRDEARAGPFVTIPVTRRKGLLSCPATPAADLVRGSPEKGGHVPEDSVQEGSGGVATLNPDEQRLAELGYKQELSRSWSGVSNFAISFSLISILAGCFTTFGSGWNGGGPAAIAWGWPVLAALILSIGLCLSELVSAFPTSGGIYWWASKLGGAKSGYYTGWVKPI